MSEKLIEDKDFVEKLENMKIRTVISPEGILVSMKDISRFKASVFMGRIDKVYYYSNGCGDSMLRDLGLSGYWALLK
uniref:Uncharacterized protein n=1 Tax=Dictyoglomus turgidum TaxID=513050 RepID=A0A7C3SPC1_9BACT